MYFLFELFFIDLILKHLESNLFVFPIRYNRVFNDQFLKYQDLNLCPIITKKE